MSEYFKLPPYNDDQPLVEHPFYQWLTANVDRKAGGHSRMLDWIKLLGFSVGDDRLSPDDVETLRFVEDHWWRCSPRFKPHTWGSLFKIPGKGGEAFHVSGSTPQSITHELQLMVVESGWVYNVHPSTTYFEVIEGRLYAKYQQIIGSRYICDIIDYKEQ